MWHVLLSLPPLLSCFVVLCRALESLDYAGAVEAYTAALAVDPQHKHVNKQLQLGLCKVQQQAGKAEEAVQVRKRFVMLFRTARSRVLAGRVSCSTAVGAVFVDKTIRHRQRQQVYASTAQHSRSKRKQRQHRKREHLVKQICSCEPAYLDPCRSAVAHLVHSVLLLQACQAALAIEPGWYEAAKQLVRALTAANRHDEAVAKARELLQQNQQDGEMHQVGSGVVDRWWGLHFESWQLRTVGCVFSFAAVPNCRHPVSVGAHTPRGIIGQNCSRLRACAHDSAYALCLCAWLSVLQLHARV